MKIRRFPEKITVKLDYFNCKPTADGVLRKANNGDLVFENVEPKIIADKMEIVTKKFHGPKLVHG